ncbi:MAG TPA: TonB-dependent receptor [Rhizomicrobium sp.]|nr:TonB-dependent receptor [Rhizomicrobium sp.]
MARLPVAFGLVSAAALLALSAPLAPALAQAAAQQPATTAPGGGQIEEVVVTATRRAEVLSKVPESISAYTTEKMDTLGIKSFADVARFTPGVTFDEDDNSISIRGINSNAGSGTTGIYIDDTPIQIRALGFGSDNTLPAIFDLDRVEVLRGPQGTLFGAGSEGGTVRYITPQPSLTDYSVYAKSEVSSTQGGDPSYEAGVAVGGPIIDDKLGFRISAWDRRDGGWIDEADVNTGQITDKNTNYVDTYVLRGALTWAPTSGLTITPSVYYQNRDRNNADQYWVGLSDPGQGNYVTATPERMGDRDHFVLPALKVDYDLGSVELISNTSYFDRREIVNDYSGTLYNLSYFQQLVDSKQDPNYNPCPGGLCAEYALIHGKQNRPPLLTATGFDLPGYGQDYISNAPITNRQRNFTQEFRVQSTDSDARLTWIAGVFYSLNAQDSIEEINDPQLPALTQYLWGEDMMTAWGENLLPNGDDYINDTTGHDRQIAGFVNATFAITPELKIQGGVRVAQTHFDFRNFADGPQNFGFSSGSGSKNETPVTPMAGITYQVTPDDMLYATYSKGYRIGGANAPLPPSCGNIPNTDSYDSDTVTSYEAGSKDKFFDNRLQVSASVYYLNWNNIQQTNYIPRCGIQYTANLGKATSKGFDFQGDWLITDDLELDGSVGYTDARYTATEASTKKSMKPLVVDGDTLPVSPWTVAIGLQYSHDVMSLPSYIRIDYEFNGRNSSLTPEQDPRTTSYDQGLVADPPTNLFSVRAGTTVKQINLALFMDNVFNSQPVLDLNHQDLHTLLYEASTERPRTFGLTATYRY